MFQLLANHQSGKIAGQGLIGQAFEQAHGAHAENAVQQTIATQGVCNALLKSCAVLGRLTLGQGT